MWIALQIWLRGIAKSIGYNNIYIITFHNKGNPSSEISNQRRNRGYIHWPWFYEVITDDFILVHNEKNVVLTKIMYCFHVETMNALARGYSLLKILFHSCTRYFMKYQPTYQRSKIYEWTRTFTSMKKPKMVFVMNAVLLWGLVNGKEQESRWLGKVRNCDVYTSKSLEEISVQQGLELSLTSTSTIILSSFLHPYRQVAIIHNGQQVGIIGEIHPQILVNHKIKKQRPCYFEIDEQTLYKGMQSKITSFLPYTWILREPLPLPFYVEVSELHHLESHQAKVQVVDRFDLRK